MKTGDWWRILAYALFVLVPLAFWWILTRVLQRGRTRTWSAVVTGGDGRLSLSRMQAFAWTLIILGSFCAAMVIRPWVVIADKAEVTAREAAVKEAKTKLDAAATAVDTATAEMVSAGASLVTPRRLRDEAQQAKTLADANAKAAAADAKVAAEHAKAAPADKARADAAKAAETRAQAAAAAAAAAAKALGVRQEVLNTAVFEVQKAEDKVDTLIAIRKAATKRHDDVREEFRRTHWVRIPLELLALAGISLATGVFAAAISASGDTGEPPVVQKVAREETPPADAEPTRSPDFLTITGTGFGNSGDVRLNRRYVRWLKWTPTEIVVEIDTATKYTTLTVDTPNGKASYELDAGLKLGVPTVIHESSDLFREDNNPRVFSMTKFQMFAWTIVAIGFYVVVFFSNLDDRIDTLPVVDATLVLLTGLSAGGYLGGKAASNMAPPK